MTSTLSHDIPPSLTLPPIDRTVPDPPDVVEAFLTERVRDWGTVPVRLPAVETCALWLVFALNVAHGAWLLAVRADAAAASGLVGTVATLGGRPTLTLVLAVTCVVVLLVAMPLTRGLTTAGGPLLGVVTAAAVCGVTAVAGVIAVLAVVALCLGMALGVLCFVVDRL